MAPTFADLGVPDSICAALRAAGITSPFPVQAATIPDLLAGRDVVGRAPTGSGKTLAFGVPLVCMVPMAEPKLPSALVLAPTRELAAQIATELQPLLAAADRRALAVYGGVGLAPQIKKLRRGVDVLVATPGRLEDLISQRVVSLENVSIVVVDEADRMADMGFLPVVRRLLNQTRNDRQTVLYSATLDGDVGKVIREYQNDPVRHEIGAATPDLTTMTHLFWKIPRSERIPLCASVIQTFGRTIVFSRTRHGADRATRQLAKLGIQAAAIHGNRSQGQRQRALSEFSSGKVQALVATDVAARGIHVDAVECVLHFDPVDEDSAYIHRSGRTARAGASGRVISFVDPGQVADVQKMKKRLNLPQEITAPPENDGGALPPTPTDEAPRPRGENGQGQGGQRQSENRQDSGQRSGGQRSGGQRSSGHRSGEQRSGEQRPGEKRERGQRGPKKKPQGESEQRSEGGKRPAKKSAKKPGKSRKQRAQRNNQTKGAPNRTKQSGSGSSAGGQTRRPSR